MLVTESFLYHKAKEWKVVPCYNHLGMAQDPVFHLKSHTVHRLGKLLQTIWNLQRNYSNQKWNRQFRALRTLRFLTSHMIFRQTSLWALYMNLSKLGYTCSICMLNIVLLPRLTNLILYRRQHLHLAWKNQSPSIEYQCKPCCHDCTVIIVLMKVCVIPFFVSVQGWSRSLN